MAENTPKPTRRSTTSSPAGRSAATTRTTRSTTATKTGTTKTSTKTASSSSSNKQGGSNKTLLILTCILGLTTGFFGWQFGVKSSELGDAIVVKEEALSERDKIKMELEAQLEELNALKGDNEEMNANIEKLKAELEAAMSELEGFREVGDLESMRRYKAQFFTFKKQVNSLRKRVKELESENAKLTEENSGLKVNLNDEKNKNRRLSNENSDLNTKVSKGSILSTYQLSVNGVKLGVGDKEKIKTKAKKVEKIRTCFTLSENKITSTGLKDVFVRVVGPDDKVLTDGGSNFNYKGKSIAYSVKDEVDYQGKAEDMCLRIKNPLGEFETGTYRIEVYVDGHKIGEENLRLD